MINKEIITLLNGYEKRFSEYIEKSIISFKEDRIFNDNNTVRVLSSIVFLEGIQDILNLEKTQNAGELVDEIRKNIKIYNSKIDDIKGTEEQWNELFYFETLWVLDLLTNSKDRAKVTIKEINNRLSNILDVDEVEYVGIINIIKEMEDRIS